MSTILNSRVYSAIGGKIDFTVAGTVVEHPAVDPDGAVFAGMAVVKWDDDQHEIVDIDELVEL